MNKLQKEPVVQKENWLQFVALQFIHLVRCVHFCLFVNTNCLQWSKCSLELTHVKNPLLQMAIFLCFWQFYSLLCLLPLPKTSISSAIHQVWRHHDVIKLFFDLGFAMCCMIFCTVLIVLQSAGIPCPLEPSMPDSYWQFMMGDVHESCQPWNYTKESYLEQKHDTSFDGDYSPWVAGKFSSVMIG